MTVRIWRRSAFAYIEDPAVADAALDRIVHNAHNLKLKGDSMRKKLSALTKEENSAN